MTTKKVTDKNKTPPAKQDKQAESERYAKASISASTMSAALSADFTKNMFPDVNLADSISVLSSKITTIQDGDMKPIEAMLIGQAQALQTMFVTLGRKAVAQTQLPHYTAFMNLALKAQSQSRATIQALTELKYPKQATFVKQANIAGGNQQVNNATSTPAHAPARAIEHQPNELLSENNNETMDTRRTATTSGTDKAMATLEK
jgi:hypothetical protein